MNEKRKQAMAKIEQMYPPASEVAQDNEVTNLVYDHLTRNRPSMDRPTGGDVRTILIVFLAILILVWLVVPHICYLWNCT